MKTLAWAVLVATGFLAIGAIAVIMEQAGQVYIWDMMGLAYMIGVVILSIMVIKSK